MAARKGENLNHPKKGSLIIVEPIRERAAIKRIKKLLESKPRDYCLFIFGINTAYRASEILSVRASQVRNLQAGDSLNLKMSKTGKYRRVSLNENVIRAMQYLLQTRNFTDDEFLFRSQRGENVPLGVDTLSTYVKRWCYHAGLKGNFASHTLRKTWGYWQRIENNTPIPLLMEALGHFTQQQTLAYLGIQPQEIQDVYMAVKL
jgi:integrase